MFKVVDFPNMFLTVVCSCILAIFILFLGGVNSPFQFELLACVGINYFGFLGFNL